MRAEILCVGSELLLGQIIDTNAAWLAQNLSRLGVDVHRKQTVGDNLERIADCIRASLSRADVLIITGGLGPTNDDLTREAIALALDAPLEFHENLAVELRAFFQARNIPLGDTILRQAYLPQGASALPNSNGTAPGVHALTDEKHIFATPGVPREMKAMFNLSIAPAILETLGEGRQIIVSRVLRTTGIGESMLAEPLEDILTSSTNPTAAPLLFGNTEVHLRLTAKARDEAEANILLDELETKIRARAGEHIFGVDDETLAAVVIREMRARGLTLAVAESVTGGLISQMLTDVPGASEVLKCAFVTYTNEAKSGVLFIPQSDLETHGAVSAQTASAMAFSAQFAIGADIAISTTGEAGPTSQSGEPVGTIWIGLAHDGEPQIFQRELSGDRDAIRRRAGMHALNVLRLHLQKL